MNMRIKIWVKIRDMPMSLDKLKLIQEFTNRAEAIDISKNYQIGQSAKVTTSLDQHEANVKLITDEANARYVQLAKELEIVI